MGDVTDFEEHKKKIMETVDTKESENDSLVGCSECGDLLFMISIVPEYTDVDFGGPYALICQHCSTPLGSAYLFKEEEE